MGGTILFEECFGETNGENDQWKSELRRLLPSLKVVSWTPGAANTEALKWWEHIEYAVIWKMKVEKLIELPKLRAVLLVGAGADQLQNMISLPAHIPIVRLVDDEVAQSMATYAVHWVLHFHRSFDEFARYQKSGTWRQLPAHKPFDEFTVGVMGHGRVGRTACDMMRKVGYRVCAWSRTPHKQDGVCTFNEEQLDSFLGQTNALVNVLPLTAETANLLDEEKIAMLPKGAIFINIGRGGTVVDDALCAALCAALDCGHLKAAVLDIFRDEPLPADSPYWGHERVVVTPHISGRSYARSAAKYVADNIKRVQAGEPPFPVVDRNRGY